MHRDDEARTREAQDALARVKRDSETLGGSALARADQAKPLGWVDHLAGKDAIGAAEDGGTDPAELWGRRIGRSLSLIGVVVLAWMLGRQVGMW
jgi:hypothetical protein